MTIYSRQLFVVISVQKITEFQNLKEEIMLLRITVPLSMFCLDCVNLNNDLALRAQRLKERLITFEVDENRDMNKK
jgi:dynein heavy chain